MKKRHRYVPISTLLQIYHALFFSHLRLAKSGDKNITTTWKEYLNDAYESMLPLVKSSLSLIFSKFLTTHRILTGFSPTAATRLKNLFSLNSYQHKQKTRGKLVRLLFRPSSRTFMYGTVSITYSTIVQ